MTPEAESMLNSFWVKQKIDNTASNRTLDTIYRIAEATARLKLKDVVDSEIAEEVMQSMGIMLLQYGHVIKIVEDPREIACQEITNIIKESKAPITFTEAVNLACHRNIQIKAYLGNNSGKILAIENNKRFRNLRDRLEFIDIRSISIVSQKPLTFVSSDEQHQNVHSTTDPNDPTDRANIEGQNRNCPVETETTTNELRSDRSDKSVMNSNYEKKNATDPTDRQQNCEYECYYCSIQTNNKDDYERHVVQKHWPKVGYPNKASLEKMGIEGKGKWWET